MAKGDLCPTCKAVNLEDLFLRAGERWPMERHYRMASAPRLSLDAIYLGLLSEVEARANLCVFCQLVIRPEVQVRRRNHHPLSLHSCVYVTGRNVNAIAEENEIISLDMLLGLYVLLTNQGDDEPITVESLDLHARPKTTIRLLEHPANPGTAVLKDLADIHRLRTYIDSC